MNGATTILLVFCMNDGSKILPDHFMSFKRPMMAQIFRNRGDRTCK
jgi:hypothetical protein